MTKISILLVGVIALVLIAAFVGGIIWLVIKNKNDNPPNTPPSI